MQKSARGICQLQQVARTDAQKHEPQRSVQTTQEAQFVCLLGGRTNGANLFALYC